MTSERSPRRRRLLLSKSVIMLCIIALSLGKEKGKSKSVVNTARVCEERQTGDVRAVGVDSYIADFVALVTGNDCDAHSKQQRSQGYEKHDEFFEP